MLDEPPRSSPSTPSSPSTLPTPSGAPPRRADRHRGRPSATARLWRLSIGTTRVLAGVVAAAVVLGSGYAWYGYRTLTTSITTLDLHAGPGAASASAGPDIDGSDQNVLLIGDDHRPANASKQLLQELSTQDDGGSVNTDTMMLMHVPANGAKATLISFPRDSWVNIPGHGMNKLNAAFTLGSNDGGEKQGILLLEKMITSITGLNVDHFVRVSLLGFYQIAQVLGPLPVCLNQAVNDPYSGANFPAGVSTLDAKQALSFVRQRHGLKNSDLDREVRQQYFLSAEFEKLASANTLLNPLKLRDLISAVGTSLETDSDLILLDFARQMANLKSGNVAFATIPTDGTPTIVYNGTKVSIVKLDTDAIPGFIDNVIGRPGATPTPASTPSLAATSAPTTSTAPSSAAPTAKPFASGQCIN